MRAAPTMACVVDLDADGDDDLVLSNEREYWVRTFAGPARGWANRTAAGKATDPRALPAITRNGELMGVWFHSGAMIQANEFNAKKPDLIERRPFSELLSP